MNLLGWFLFGVFFMLGALAVNCVAALLVCAIEDFLDRRSDKKLSKQEKECRRRNEENFNQFIEDMKDKEHMHKYDMYVGDGHYYMEESKDADDEVQGRKVRQPGLSQ